MFFDRFCIFATSLCILPACAGINPINFLFFLLAGYSPRMRGGQPSFMATLDRPEEFSPHARGSTSFDARGKHTFDILPACAGSTLRGDVRTTRRDGIHPACAGVNPALSSSHGSKKGFSLHARGSTRQLRTKAIADAIYPACARVNPPNNRHSFVFVILPARAGVNPGHKVYSRVSYSPRIRGGQPRTPSPFEGDIGFSPHARGSP